MFRTRGAKLTRLAGAAALLVGGLGCADEQAPASNRETSASAREGGRRFDTPAAGRRATAPADGAEATREPPAHPTPPPEPPPESGGAAPGEPPILADPIPWILAAGGSIPEFGQVQIEQDVALAASVLPGGGKLLFGAGAGAPVVQVLAPSRPTDPVRDPLADLLSPRGGRDATYRAPTFVPHEAATAKTLLASLELALAEPGPPLLLGLLGHGELGATPRDNLVALWAQSAVTPGDLAAVLDRARRSVHLVATTCFSGGLGELAFRGADPVRGAATPIRCGLFAAPWDLEASGCAPDPDRASQQGYALHFFQALRGVSRDGKLLPKGALDLDGDGAISLLEAHTRVRIASASADVPTSTSERWLRAHDEPSPRIAFVDLPEEDAVVAALGEQLSLAGHEPDARTQLQRLETELDGILDVLEDAQAREDADYRAAAAEILARWPVLDDPWHPEFADTLRRATPALREHFATAPSYAAYLASHREVSEAHERMWRVRTEAAPYERLVRALDNRELAARLRGRGGTAWAGYEALLACERSLAPTP